jgi:hypothetical protein
MKQIKREQGVSESSGGIPKLTCDVAEDMTRTLPASLSERSCSIERVLRCLDGWY